MHGATLEQALGNRRKPRRRRIVRAVSGACGRCMAAARKGCSHLRAGEQSKFRRTLGVALWRLEGDAGRSSARTWRKEDV